MRGKSGLLNFTVAIMLCSCAGNRDFETEVRKAVVRQMEIYPESTLKDIYKNFFQDRFGPGHIINDTAAAKNYLIHELNSFSTISGQMAEPTGWQHNFYRVNLGAVKNSLVSCEVLLDAFIRSANAVEPVTVEEWRKEWSQIESVIRTMNLSLPDCETDCREIEKRLQEGNYIGHHSVIFNETYTPHYRIISRKIFEEEFEFLIK